MNLGNSMSSGATFCLSKAGLAIGGTATKAKIAAPNGAGVDYVINDVHYHKADTDDCILFTGLTQSADTTCIYLVCLSTGGTVSVVQGSEVASAALTDGREALKFPNPTSGTCPIGYIKLAVTSAFTGATTALSDAAVTDTYVDLFTIPTRPLTA